MKNLIISFCFLTISLIVSGQSGNVGIGTTAPADKLHVMGGFIAEETMIIMESDAPPVFTMGSASSSSDSSAVLYDSGGPSGDYSNNENYSFLINYIQGAHAVQLSVDSMYTESPYDKLILTWGDGRSDTLSGTPTGVFRGQFPVTIDFETNEVNTDMGFKISWNGLAFPSGDTADIEGPGVRVQWLPGKRAFRVGSVTGSQWDFENIGYSSFAQGYSNIASGPLSVAMGSWNISSGYSSFVLGSNSKATENYATAIGSNTTASNYYTLATGATTRASGYGSTTFGFNTDAEAYLGVALGKYNVGGGNPDSWIPTDPIFEIGIGQASGSSRRNAMTIFKNAGALWEGVYNEGIPDPPPAEGIGTRMMWYPDKAAFRVGHVAGPQWDRDSIGAYSVAMGFASKANGIASTALGYATSSPGAYSTATGYAGRASGLSSTSTGWATVASGFAATSMGRSTDASGTHSVAMGYSTITESYSSLAIGQFNVGGGTAGSWVETDPVFEIGIGTNSGEPANAMTIYKNGNALWEGTYNPDAANPPPAQGEGVRMMWYPEKAAFRAGKVDFDNWDSENIGNVSVAMGYGTTASGLYSTAFGYGSAAVGDFSTALGAGTGASGNNAFATGDFTSASGNTSTAMGNSTSAAGRYSTSMGWFTKADAMACVALGYNNIGGGSATTWVATDPLFEIGNGNSGASNALTVLKNGNVGIGTYTPSSDLEVIGTLKVDAIIQASDASGLYLRTDGNATALRIHDNGNVGIGTTAPGSHRLYVTSGETTASGATGYIRNTHADGIALSIENTSWSSNDNVLLVSNKGSTGDLASFDSWHGTNSWDREFKFTNDGDGRCDGSWIAGGADYAEFFDKADPAEGFEPGDVICMSPDKGYSVIKAVAGREQLLVGVYSTNPAVVGNSSAEEDPDNAVLVGMMGVVPTKVSTENGPIAIGDFLALSSRDGVAAKATRSGMVIGRAMESYDGTSHGIIKVMVEPEWVQLERDYALEALLLRNEQLEASNLEMQKSIDYLMNYVRKQQGESYGMKVE